MATKRVLSRQHIWNRLDYGYKLRLHSKQCRNRINSNVITTSRSQSSRCVNNNSASDSYYCSSKYCGSNTLHSRNQGTFQTFKAGSGSTKRFKEQEKENGHNGMWISNC